MSNTPMLDAAELAYGWKVGDADYRAGRGDRSPLRPLLRSTVAAIFAAVAESEEVAVWLEDALEECPCIHSDLRRACPECTAAAVLMVIAREAKGA